VSSSGFIEHKHDQAYLIAASVPADPACLCSPLGISELLNMLKGEVSMAQPWTVSRGPIVAGDIDIQKSVAINSLLVRPIGILPAEPGDPTAICGWPL
jgi:hypothetical protein